MKVNTEIPILFQKIKQYEAEDTRFLKVKIWLMHLGENLNGSHFSKESVEAAIPTLANTPILAYIEDNSDGEQDFSDHRQVLVKEDGQYKVKYIGQAIGTISTENNAQFETRLCDDGIEREFLTVEGLIWQKWDDPIDIFNRDIIKAQSMELHTDYSGEWKEDNLYHFSSFKFFGACALGKEVIPAMRNATIEAQFNFDKMFAEIQHRIEQFKKVEVVTVNTPVDEWKCPHCTNFIAEKELFYDGENWFHSPCISYGIIELPEQEAGREFNNINKQEGGFKEVTIQELLAKYSLTVEDLKAKEIEFESCSIEELENKIQEVFTSEETETNFALTYSQLRDEIRAELYNEKTVDSWGYEYSKYWYVDFDDSKVIAEDGEDSYRLISLDYTVTGDKVSINFDSKQRVKIVYAPFEGESDVAFEIVSKDRLDYDLKVKEKEVEQTYSASDSVVELDTLKAQFASLETEVQGLREFKNSSLLAERKESEDGLFEQFSTQLSEEEMKEVKDNASNYTLDEIETQLFALVGKKNTKFTAKSKAKETVKIDLDITHDDPKNEKPYAHIVEKYTKK